MKCYGIFFSSIYFESFIHYNEVVREEMRLKINQLEIIWLDPDCYIDGMSPMTSFVLFALKMFPQLMR